jgi:hypothetical protein
MAETNLKKNKDGYGYKYTELAEIHNYLEKNNMKYYQEIETNEANGQDYIMTYRYIDGKWEEKPKRGCKVVDATLQGIKNPAQEQGSALTYARRYSLLMAFGLATEDDDAQSLSRPKEEITTREQAENYKLTFGKHAGKTIKELVETEPNYCNWLYENGNDTIKKCLNLMLEDK